MTFREGTAQPLQNPEGYSKPLVAVVPLGRQSTEKGARPVLQGSAGGRSGLSSACSLAAALAVCGGTY